MTRINHRRAVQPSAMMNIAFVLIAVATPAMIANAKDTSFDSIITPFFKAHCHKCHGPDAQNGDLRLDDIQADFEAPKDLARWQSVLEQVSIGEMPPKEQHRPEPELLSKVIQWIERQLVASGNASDFEVKLRTPAYGNYINHEKLFSGEITTMPFSPRRLWRKSPDAFNYSKNFVFGKPRYSMFHTPTTNFGGLESARPDPLPAVKQAFAIEDKQGFKDYADLLYADSSTLDTLMRNATVIADHCLEGVVKELELKQQGLTLAEWREQVSARDKEVREQLRRISEKRDLAQREDPNSKEALDLEHEYRKLKSSWKSPRVKDTANEFRAISMSDGVPPKEMLHKAIARHFSNCVQRHPTEPELSKYTDFFMATRPAAGNLEALRLVLMAIVISPEAVYRMELGIGKEDQFGRQMLAPFELAFAISLSLTDAAPDDTLIKCVTENRLNSREDVRREVVRLLDDDQTQKPRILRFFHEYFGYHRAPAVFKDDKRFNNQEFTYGAQKYPEKLVADTDVLVRHIIQHDKDVLKELLTTDKYFVQHKGNNEHSSEEALAIEQFYQYFKDRNWKAFEYTVDPKHQQFTRSINKPYFFKAYFFQHLNGNSVKFLMKYYEKCHQKNITPSPLFAFDEKSLGMLFAYNLDPATWDYPVHQPFQLPGKRVGILSHPSWLIAHSLNLLNDPIRRGKWIRERLLGGTIPDVPITVDASIPDDPHKTLRERLSVTEQPECWTCHQKMNPLGYPFESFNDFGMLRDREPLEQLDKIDGEYQTKSIDTRGTLDGSGSDQLDGEVADHAELMHRLAASEKVRQVFVRHAFRYWMGRNEMLSDSKVLIEADNAYVNNGGSFRALLISLLTSDSFIYRKSIE